MEKSEKLERCNINSTFKTNLLIQISNSAELIPWREPKLKLEALDAGSLNVYGVERWENILYFIVGNSINRPHPSGHIVNLLLKLNLVQRERSTGSFSITNTGYSFLLRPLQTQIWYFLTSYIGSGATFADIMTLIFRFCFCIPGSPYCSSLLSPNQQILLSDLMEIGLIYKDQSSDFFYPTKLATLILVAVNRRVAESLHGINPFSEDEQKEEEQDKKIEIIVETNFKCYIYTTSKLHLEMLKLFLEIEITLPNLIVGVITRRSIKNAFHKNIKAKNLISFLEANAHPLCLKKARVVPDNITDQIMLWEMERDRISSKAGVLYEEFASEEEFKKAVDFSVKKGLHQWSNLEKMRLFVLEEHHSIMRDFFSPSAGLKN